MASPSIPGNAPTALRVVLFAAFAQLYRTLVSPQVLDGGLATTLTRLRQCRDTVVDGPADAANAYGGGVCRTLEDLRGAAHGVAQVLAADGRAAMVAEVDELAELAHALASVLQRKMRA